MPQIVDPFQRNITYLRVSVTDRCDLRCQYCMAERMNFMPKTELLTIEELTRICANFVSLGVKKIRVTGGEPLTRRNIISFFEQLSQLQKTHTLEEIMVTTNATHLSQYAQRLFECGVKRVNVSLDTLDPDKFKEMTRGGNLLKVLKGIEDAQLCGLKVKINVVVLKNFNDQDIAELIIWAHKKNMDITLIEVMPMGDIGSDRINQYVPLSVIKDNLAERFTLTPIDFRTSGPARYDYVEETGGRLGFITPLTHNFCTQCNRVRLTCSGQLYMCLGQSDKADLKAIIRQGGSDTDIQNAIKKAIQLKPKGHDFTITHPGQKPSLERHMSHTGG